MRLAFPVSILIGITLAACQNDDPDGWETWNGDEADTGTETDTGESTTEDDDTTEDSTTGEPEIQESLRYLVTGTDDALLLGVDLDDPLDVPEPTVIVSGEGTTGLFGPTPFNSEMVVHDGVVDQLRVNDFGDYDFLPLTTPEAYWMDRALFSFDGSNAFISVGPQAFGVGNELWWMQYDPDGELAAAYKYQPPIDPNGSVIALGRSPDGKYTAVLVDVEADNVWQLWVVVADPLPGLTVYIDQMDFTGLAPAAIADFVWLHLDNERIVYRKEGEPGIFRPLAVALANPEVDRINLTPALGHISTLVWSPDNTRLLVTTGGGNGYRELWMIQLDGPTQVQPPLRISEPGQDALVDTQTIDLATLGHGFDNYGRIWYAYTDTMLADPATVGIKIAVVVDNDVISRTDLTELAPNLTFGDVAFDANLQLLGYRSQTANLSSINYVDLTETMADSVRIDQDFEYSASTPGDSAAFAWSPDGSRMVIVGKQNAMTSLHVAQMDDPLGATTEITLPDVEAAQGITLDHAPRVSPDGEQVILWYAVLDGHTGLVHAPTDGSGEGQVVLGMQYSLRDGAFLQHVPE